MSDLTNKAAIITGANQGLGKGIAFELAMAGADIVITHLDNAGDRDKAGVVIDEITALGNKAIALPLDVTNEKSIKTCVQETLRQFPQLDILVNNAGVMQINAGLKTTSEDFDRCHEVNLKGVWCLTHELIPHFQAQRQGNIVNISSGAARRGSPHLPAYCASKAAVVSLTQSLALALSPYNITVNAVCPGIIWTSMCASFTQIIDNKQDDSGSISNAVSELEFVENIKETIPLNRPQTAEDIGHAVVFFASAKAKNITGQALNVDGGIMMN